MEKAIQVKPGSESSIFECHHYCKDIKVMELRSLSISPVWLLIFPFKLARTTVHVVFFGKPQQTDGRWPKMLTVYIERSCPRWANHSWETQIARLDGSLTYSTTHERLSLACKGKMHRALVCQFWNYAWIIYESKISKNLHRHETGASIASGLHASSFCLK